MRSNRPTLEDIIAEPRTAEGLPLDVAQDLMAEAKKRSIAYNSAGKLIEIDVVGRFRDRIEARYRAEAKDTGVVRVADGDFEIVADRSKKVEWDQSAVASTVAAIRDLGDDPTEYVDITYSVPERKYSAWPESIRKTFEPARTVRPGSLTVNIVATAAAAKQEAA